VRIAWHSIFAYTGSVLAGMISIRLARHFIRDQRVYPYAIAVFVGGLITARLGHVADNWAAYADSPEKIVALAGGGIAVTAAPIGSTIAGLIAGRWMRLPMGFMLDVSAIGIVTGLAVGRIGDVINGEHHTVACSALAWCVRYTHPETLGQMTFVHPVVVYDALVDLLIAALAYTYWRRIRGRAPEGRAYLVVLGVYGVGRFVSSFLRLDPVVLAGLQEAQVLGLAYAFIAFPLLWLLERQGRARIGLRPSEQAQRERSD